MFYQNPTQKDDFVWDRFYSKILQSDIWSQITDIEYKFKIVIIDLLQSII